MPDFEIWESPGGLVWEGVDQEEAFLTALRRRRRGIVIEVAEIRDMFDQVRPRRIACYGDRQGAEVSD
ncbi:MAG: hypothetical protein ACT4P5_14275 [Armatimonadota bacterium]